MWLCLTTLFFLQTDARVQAVTEVMNVIRMIKAFGWEKRIDEKIAGKREEELACQRKRVILEIISNILKCVQLNRLWVVALTIRSFFIPIITMIVTFACYVGHVAISLLGVIFYLDMYRRLL